MAYDNIKSHKKEAGLYPFSEKHIFGKTTGVLNLSPFRAKVLLLL